MWVLQISAYTSIELLIFIFLIRVIVNTANKLRGAEYVKYRSKQIGFRFFFMQNTISFVLFILADVVIVSIIPRDFALKYLVNPPYVHSFFNAQFGSIPRLINYATTVITAYVNLPADSVGVMGWFKGSAQIEDVEKAPITLKVRSKRSDFNLNSMSSCIVFELLVELFNFSTVAYLQKSKAFKSQLALEYANERGCYLELEIFNEVNETYATPVYKEAITLFASKYMPNYKPEFIKEEAWLARDQIKALWVRDAPIL